MIVQTWIDGRRVRVNLAVADIEEGIARMGWMILNGITSTAEERAEVGRIERQGYAAMTTTPNDAYDWWRARVVE